MTSRYRVLLFTVVAIICWVCPPNATAQVGCTSGDPSVCIDPVPATNLSNTWIEQPPVGSTEVPSEWWIQAANNATIGGTGTASGVVYVFMPKSIDPIGNCPVYQYTATGSYNPSQLVDGQEGSTAFTWTASNPSPNTPCNGYVPVPSMTFTGTMVNKSTDSGSGTWTNSSGLSGSFVFEADPNIIPTGETVQAGGWNSSLPTEANFIQVLTDSRSYDPDPNHNLFQGRQVWETTASTGTDGCYQAA